MINFNDLPCDVLDLIFKHNRSWTSKEISKNKSVFNVMIKELNHYLDFDYKTSRLPYILRLHKRHAAGLALFPNDENSFPGGRDFVWMRCHRRESI